MILKFLQFYLIFLFFVVCFSVCGCNLNSNPVKSKKNEQSNIVSNIAQSNIYNNNKETIEGNIWELTSENFHYIWNSGGFFVVINGKPKINIFSEYARKYVKKYKPQFGEKAKCERIFNFKILSIVGTFASIEESSFSDCESKQVSHANSKSRLFIVDLSENENMFFFDKNKLKTNIKLTDFFSIEDIFKALIELPEIKRTLEYSEIKNSPLNYKELIEVIDTVGADGIDGTAHKLTDESFYSFCFYEKNNKYVDVLVELKSEAGSSQPTLKLRLPSTEKLDEMLDLADKEKSGFLTNKYLEKFKVKSSRISLYY